MSTSPEKIERAMKYAMEHRPQVGGFPFLAACLQKAGVKHNIWSLPAVMSMYLMDSGEYIINQGTPLMTGMAVVPPFDQDAIIAAIRTDQAGESTFPVFLQAIWNAGGWGYDVDFEKRTVTYMGSKGELYTESYPSVDVEGLAV